MRHTINWNEPARLMRCTQVAQFGDGYRQLTGATTLAEGTVDEMIALAKSQHGHELGSLYFRNGDKGVPLTLQEVEALRADGL